MALGQKVSSGTPANSDGEGIQANVKVDKQRRYDRGIRVWGTHGQEALERARICLLNCGPTGSEALKNMVLGGIHSYTIVDGQRVGASDLGNNYLVTAAGLGSSRAQCVAECLKELNDSVAGSFVEEDPSELIENNPAFFSNFDLVIATQLQETQAATLDAHCRELGVSLLLARSYGLVGYLRNCVAEHCVIESKPDNELFDLRLGNPWPELAAAAAATELEGIDESEHSHIPYASEVQALLSDGALAEPLTPSTPDFWVLVGALKRFIECEGAGLLPLEGSLPDMHASTQRYLELQHLYKEKADKDAAAVEAHVRTLLKNADRDPGSIPSSEIKRFCKHSRHLRVVRSRPLGGGEAAESTGVGIGDALRSALSSEDSSADTSLHVLLRAADRFYQRHQRFPGTFDVELEEDVAQLKALAATVLLENGVSGVGVCDDLVGEIIRFGAGELQVVAAVMGAMASQEAIKLLTAQCVPLKGTLVYNAMRCTMSLSVMAE